MRPDEHQRMFDFEDHYWWFVGRQAIIRALLDQHLKPTAARRILDLGCGSGATLALLDDYGHAVGLDPFPAALQLCHRRNLRVLVAADAVTLPFDDSTFDLVTGFDTFEHIADDRAALLEAGRVLRPGGQLLLTVPAYQFLWSEHDEALDHFRRYTAGMMRERLEGTGFRVQRLTYAISFLLPAAIVLRLGQRLLPQPQHEPQAALMELPGPLNRFCLATLRLEARLLRHIDLPAGVSVVAMAEKR